MRELALMQLVQNKGVDENPITPFHGTGHELGRVNRRDEFRLQLGGEPTWCGDQSVHFNDTVCLRFRCPVKVKKWPAVRAALSYRR